MSINCASTQGRHPEEPQSGVSKDAQFLAAVDLQLFSCRGVQRPCGRHALVALVFADRHLQVFARRAVLRPAIIAQAVERLLGGQQIGAGDAGVWTCGTKAAAIRSAEAFDSGLISPLTRSAAVRASLRLASLVSRMASTYHL